MNERTKNLLAALAALAIVATLLAPGQRFAPASIPTTEDTETAGYAALFRWLEHHDREPISHRARFDRLGGYGSGNLLVMTWPFARHVELEEWDNLKQFLNDGNRLLLLAAPMGSERWAIGGSPALDEVYEQLGINCGCTPPDETALETKEPAAVRSEGTTEDDAHAESISRLFSSNPLKFYPAVDDPLLDGVEVVNLERTVGVPTNFDDTVSATPLLKREDGTPGAAWFLSTDVVPAGLFLFTHPDLLNNEGLSQAGPRDLVRNLISQFVSDEGHIIFDDFHHGLSDVYDAAAFFSDPRLWWSIFAVMLLWLLYVVFYNTRLGPVIEQAEEISNAAFAGRTGTLYARHASTQQVNRKLLESFNNQYRRRYHQPPDGESVHGLIADDYRFNDQDRRTLENIERSPSMSPLRVQNELHRLYLKLNQES